jgi:hypothetical protein
VKACEEGNRDPELVYATKALNKVGRLFKLLPTIALKKI